MLLAASSGLSAAWAKNKADDDIRLLPPLSNQYEQYSLEIAKAVIAAAIEDKVTHLKKPDIDQALADIAWSADYYSIKPA